MKTKIAIQGFKASFHEIAAIKFFGEEIETVECGSFTKLFDVMANQQADFAVCAIENSLAGSLLNNYANIGNSNLEIIGEVYLRIGMNLMALEGQKIEDLEEVHSHPIALLQCRNFFRNYPNIQIVESSDTALSAEEIYKNQIKKRGAVASKRAAKINHLEILAEDIHDNKRNFTRFLILEDKSKVNSRSEFINKASISFRAFHTPGSLAKILTVIGEHQINLTKIQSLPVIGEEWQYYMYADLEFEDKNAYQTMKKQIEPLCKELKILGEYERGKKIIVSE
ncbi:MAG TPA: prephenate dehydratase [Chitinophagales bacterium]|nr:prephenate dehydratase [Chitinophagales bacterium]MCB9075580.1 prephenate dehydratase [Chitinophagales bacterium]HMU97659.1 prephenate dehydratase [Chitinophagales bacterium]HMV01931.1 prephenate dehydratase [Chitinophagales bacterium]HMW93869.1 prephenate dehydratase [Chitinophagales bacterium]